MTTKRTSPARFPPRPPTIQELQDLKTFLLNNCRIDESVFEGSWSLADECIAVFDHYHTDGPGYAGKMMVWVSGGCPDTPQAYFWVDEQIEEA